MFMLNESRICWLSILALVLGYMVYIAMISHSVIYPEMYEGLNFITMLDAMYFVALFWLACCILSGLGSAFLWYRGMRNWKISLLLLLSITPLTVWGAEVVVNGI